MKKNSIFKKLGIISVLAASSLCLTSCQQILDYLMNLFNQLMEEEYNPDDYATVAQENGEYSKFTYQDLNNASDDPFTPARGNVNILVIPVQWSDLSSYSSSQLEAIDASFNGNKDNSTNDYWESVKSFYYKSSNGILNFNFNITDVYVPTYRSTVFNSQADSYGTEMTNLLDDIYTNGIKINDAAVNFRDSKWDSNSDGYIDGIWVVHNQRDSAQVDSNHFRAYSANYNGNKSASKMGKYGNAALSFLYSDSSKGYDAHTMIHETGHMLGLDDYYDYNSTSNSFSYSGCLDMMDLNIGDHNAYSKHALGWTKSLVVTESTTLTLKPFEESYDSIIIPSSSYNGSAFSEYILIELYTPTGLFKLDAMKNYSNTYPKFFSKAGLRVWHIDARLAYMNYYGNSNFQFGNYLPSTITSIPQWTSTSTKLTYVTVAHTNSIDDTTRNKDGKPLIELASRTRSRLYNNRNATDLDLFVSGDTIDASKLSPVLNSGKFYDGSAFSASIKVDSLNSTGAELTFTF